MKSGPELLADYEDNWVTDIGAWFPGERVVYRGRDLLDDIAAKLDWFQLLMLGCTGREYTKSEAQLIAKIYTIGTSFPEPRLWNNRIASLGGTTRTTANLAVSAANAASEATVYGCRPIIKAMDLLIRADHAKNSDDLSSFIAKEIKLKRALPGFGRPLVNKDERIEPLLREAELLGFSGNKYTNLAHEISNLSVLKRLKVSPNVAVIAAGLCADIGLAPREFYLLSCVTFMAGIIPCNIGAAQQPEGTFFPLACSRINSTNQAYNRKWNIL